MSPRLKRIRKVVNPPIIKGFKPYGPEVKNQKPEPVYLLYEEYEALRLCDYDGYNHHHASIVMGISRPTYTRIYASAREKIARAFVEGRQITIEGGKVYFDSDWYQCKKCLCHFNNPERMKKVECCPLCGSQRVTGIVWEDPAEGIDPGECKDYCICPECGYEQEHVYGSPCSQHVCPECGSLMIRKRTSNCNNYNYI
ncbi:MAG: DUF134 domain-containing protein [Bacteroidales bacterium]|nr:DUF134 domain-containing protein [Lentimicrobiaceae bacterium]MDD5695531.1 DUF134 domain-containing protein [Bacteroidales bacterium]